MISSRSSDIKQYYPVLIMSESFTFLFAPVDATGHFNACIGIAEPLRDRGHKIVFATPVTWKGKLKPYGFEEEIYAISPEPPVVDEIELNDKWGEIISGLAPALAMEGKDHPKNLLLPLFTEGLRQVKFADARLREIMATVKPDCVVVDTVFHNPALLDAGVPWVFSSSVSPLGITTKDSPRAFGGISIADGDRELWAEFDAICDDAFGETEKEFKEWLRNNGGPKDLPNKFPFLHAHSKYANIYMYPIELDYTPYRQTPPNWHRFDTFVRTNEKEFEMPEKLKGLPGKLIYVSMGSIGCSEMGLMKKLVGILAKSPHRFIFSKGPLADRYELAENMWGMASVPQTKVIPLVDLVITHGGNNTITESFYFGKRVIVLPLFCDQLDNATRIYETGLGLQFHPYKVKEHELLRAIEKILADDMLERRIISISHRMQSSNSQAHAADVVEKVARDNYVTTREFWFNNRK